MSLSINIFGKNIKDLTAKDIEDFFGTEQEESISIEFKSGNVELDSIYREVSSFLNMSGGILLIGSPKKSSNELKKEFYIGELIPCKIIKSSQSLLQKISSFVVPSPIGIEIQEISYKEGKLFILEIPQSMFPPHQNSLDGKYYIRLDSETQKAPHGFIQALFNQRQFSNLEKFISFPNENSNHPYLMELNITNSSNVPAEQIGVMIDLHGVSYLKAIRQNKMNLKGNINLIYEDPVQKTEDSYSFTFSNKMDMLVKGLMIKINIEIGVLDSNYLLVITTWAKNSELKTSYIIVNPTTNEFLFQSNEELSGQYSELFEKYKIKSKTFTNNTNDNPND